MVKVVSVKFKNGCKPYYFSPCKQELSKGVGVIVETSKGLEYATVVDPLREVEESEVVEPLMPVVRVATPKDMEQLKRNEERRGEGLKIAREKIAARGLEMKPVACEFSFDGSKVIIYFTAENRVDFRELIKDLSSAFHMRIELRQIGIRDEIKLMGGLAPCGRECCCVRSLEEPKKVSVKMAKNQGLSLNPSKISGLCGRLMCCLSYENDYYAEAFKKVPKLGSTADTPDGKGTVVNVNMLKMIVKVKIEQGDSVSYHDYPLDKIAFMRGNEVIGKVGGEDDDDDVLTEEDETDGAEPSAINEPAPADNAEKREDDRENNRNNNRNRNRNNRHGGKNGNGNNGGNNANEGAQANKPRADRPQNGNKRGNGERTGERRNEDGAVRTDGNANGAGGEIRNNRNNRNHKKHRGGNRNGGKENTGAIGNDKLKNNE